MPPSVQRRTPSTTSRRRSPRSRSSPVRICCRRSENWQEIADYALDWALEHSVRHAGAGARRVRITHIGGPTALIEIGGWRLLDGPDVRPAGGSTGSAGAPARARRRVRRCRPPSWVRSTRCWSRTTTTTTTSTPPGGRCCRRLGVVVTTASGAKRLGGSGARSDAVGVDDARGARQGAARDHRDAVPPRAAGVRPDRRRRDRVLLRRRSGCPATPSSTTACARSRTGWTVDVAVHPSGRRAVPDHRTAAVHDDRAARRSSCWI